MRRKKRITEEKLDYILIREMDKSKVSLKSRVIKSPAVSDHLAIISTIAIKL